MVAHIRFDLENNFTLTRLEAQARELFEKQGRDFEEEYKKWMEEKGEEVVI
jgi:hypothetical protein